MWPVGIVAVTKPWSPCATAVVSGPLHSPVPNSIVTSGATLAVTGPAATLKFSQSQLCEATVPLMVVLICSILGVGAVDELPPHADSNKITTILIVTKWSLEDLGMERSSAGNFLAPAGFERIERFGRHVVAAGGRPSSASWRP